MSESNNEEEIQVSKKKVRKQYTYSYEEQLKNWYLHVKNQLAKRNYKKAIKDITSTGIIGKFIKIRGGYKIIILYIQAKLKIIEKKIFKYHISTIESIKIKHQISHCFHYVKDITEELNLLLLEISDNNLYDNDYYNNLSKRNYKIELFDDIIRCHFDYIYTLSFLHYKIGNILESISYLSLFLTLYKETNQIILSNHTLFKIEKCFILLSKIYIANEDYENALKFLNEAIKISFKQIVFQVHDIYFGVFVGTREQLEIREKEDLFILKDSRIKRVILNIVIIFLYQGICNEHLASIKKATAFYKQCEWFARIFLAKSNQSFYKLFYNLKKSGIVACNIIDLVNEKIEQKEEKEAEEMEENFIEMKNKKYSKKRDKLYKAFKFKGLVKKLQELNIREIDTVNKFIKNKNIKISNMNKREGKDKNLYLSNVRLLEAYLRKDFEGVVKNMDKINIFDIDYKSRALIQNTLNNIYFNQNQKAIKKTNYKTILNNTYRKDNKDNTTRNNENINIVNNRGFKGFNNNEFKSIDSVLDFRKRIKLNYGKRNINLSKHTILNNQSLEILSDNNNNNKNNSNFSFYQAANRLMSSPKYQKINFSSSSSFLLNTSRQPNQFNKSLSKYKDSQIEKTQNKNTSLGVNKSSKFKIIIRPENKKLNDFFNKKYIKKREYIKQLSDRELLFQKSLLKSKNTRRFSFQKFNKSEVEQDANRSFTKIESVVSPNVGNTFLKDLTADEYKEFMVNNKLENALIHSLDNRALINYKENIKIKEKEEERKILRELNKYNKKFGNIKINNENTLKELNKKLNSLYENEDKKKKEIVAHLKEVKKQMYKKFHRNKSAFNRNKNNKIQ